MIHLIEEAELRDNAYMDKGCSNTDLITALELAQEVMLAPKIGDELYDKILEEVAAYIAGGPETPYITFLFSKVTNTLTYYTAYQLARLKFARITSSGTNSYDGEDNVPTGLEEHKMFIESIRSLYITYENKMIDYLTANADTFPEFNVEEAPGDDFSTSVQIDDVNSLRVELEEEGYII